MRNFLIFCCFPALQTLRIRWEVRKRSGILFIWSDPTRVCYNNMKKAGWQISTLSFLLELYRLICSTVLWRCFFGAVWSLSRIHSWFRASSADILLCWSTVSNLISKSLAELLIDCHVPPWCWKETFSLWKKKSETGNSEENLRLKKEMKRKLHV